MHLQVHSEPKCLQNVKILAYFQSKGIIDMTKLQRSLKHHPKYFLRFYSYVMHCVLISNIIFIILNIKEMLWKL